MSESSRFRHEPLAWVKPDGSAGVRDPGFLRVAPGAAAAALCLPAATLPGHAGGKPAHPGPGRRGPRPAHSHVLLSGGAVGRGGGLHAGADSAHARGLPADPGGQAVARSTCAAQMGLFVALGGSECLLLAAMALDRYLAICRPLCYPRLMTAGRCRCLLASCCVGGSLLALGLTVAIFQLPFCRGGLVNHVFCDLPAVLVLACGDWDLQERVLLAACLLLLVLPLVLILLSYTRVLAVILGVGGVAGRRKAFNTVASHLTVAVLHYGCATAMYARPLSSRSLEEDELVSLVYINLTPLLYPAIYTLRNRDVQGALWRVVGGRTSGNVVRAEVSECCVPDGVWPEISPTEGNLTIPEPSVAPQDLLDTNPSPASQGLQNRT
ncbi:RB-associated KRAB zinc finger protein isoform X3 [Acinonyx jubatus]|uniref:Olfactory receptor n=1 Tax=Acinonyx jubatus TaxID=32536 RepID=A0ABM3PCW7_ACIJB|nr:RB-associated KRAB zinc finger protein isoform X3 [Acinonyx jubatus]